MYLTTILYCKILAYLYTSLDCTTTDVPHYYTILLYYPRLLVYLTRLHYC